MATEDRGFASMDRDRQREIARAGGKAAWAKGTAHRWTSEAAAKAGRKGGSARKVKAGGVKADTQASNEGAEAGALNTPCVVV